MLAFWLLLLQHTAPRPLEAIRLRVEDSLYLFQHLLKREHRPAEELLVVEVDEKSINRLGRWPWSRHTIARLVERLSEAELVAFDVVFSEPAEGDTELAKAIQGAGNVLLGFFLRREATEKTSPEAIDLLSGSELLRVKKLSDKLGLLEFPYAETNIPLLAGASLMQAPFNSEPDPDGLYRRYTVAYLFNGSIYPSMALQAYRLYRNTDLELEVSQKGIERARLGSYALPLSQGRFLLLNFPDLSRINRLSAVELLDKKVSLKGKVVFFGVTEIGIYDMRPTPLDPSTPGVYLHYTALSNLLKDDLIRDYSHLSYLATLLAPVLPLPLFRIRRLKGRALLFVLLFLALLSLPFLSFAYLKAYLPFFYPSFALLVSYAGYEAYVYVVSERRVGELRRAFSSYLSPQLLEVVLKNPERLRLGGEKREITVLFSDLRGFTTLSEGLEPERLVSVLNQYLEPMTLLVLEEGGTLDKYIGDAIMAVFNAPVDLPDHADRACRTALKMVQRLKSLNEEVFKPQYGLELAVGIGINTGYAVVGNMGSNVRFDYTAIGDMVNLASRLEGLNKLYKTNIIISEYTAGRLKEDFLLRKLDRVAVKGKRQAVLLYELMEKTERNMRIKELYEKALEKYFEGSFEEALLMFEELVIEYGDGPSETMAKRCKSLLLEPPEGWEGVYVAKEK